MVISRLAAILLALLAFVPAAGATRVAHPRSGAAPADLHGFVLRADEPRADDFARTPSFAWKPVSGSVKYEFQLSTSAAFRDSGLLYTANKLLAPVVSVDMTLPWITGEPHALYARVRAVRQSSVTPWSQPFGFNMTPPAAPEPLPSYPGLLRWSPVEGADGYEIWLIDANRKVKVNTNVLDEREFYTFHQLSAWTATVRWRIRVLRDGNAKPAAGATPPSSGRIDDRSAVMYGDWTAIYVSSNPPPPTGLSKIRLIGTVSDVFSDGSPDSPAQRLMPAFLFSGNQAEDGTPVELYRIYVFTDKQCLNRVYTSAVIGSPAYSPRPYGPLSLPTSPAAVAAARTSYLPIGTEPIGLTYDGDSVSTTESATPATPTTTLPLADGSGGASSPFITWSASSSFGAPTDLWDTDWPQGGYYWTVVPVVALAPGSLQGNLALPTSPADTKLTVTSADGFAVGDGVLIGVGGSQEGSSITQITGTTITIGTKLTFAHSSGDPIVRASGGLQYRDLELAQDACSSGRVSRFGKSSEPSLTSAGRLFASGLAPTSPPHLTSALHAASFYGTPLVSWTPALGATAYQVQWSKKLYPFTAEPDPATKAAGLLTTSTSTVLPLGAGKWWYRVRGYNYSLQTSSQAMGWSDPVQIVVARPRFTIVPRLRKR
ncbi:MAG: hypothetical protein ABR569_02325 [Gaiellaceae bacterium]